MKASRSSNTQAAGPARGTRRSASEDAHRTPAPVFVDAFSLCEWLLGRLGNDGRVLSLAICRSALRVLDDVALALRRSDPVDLVADADERLVSLRVQLRLAAVTDVLSDEQALFALEAANAIGRQLGGWRRSLEPE